MKKIPFLVLCGALSLSLTACANSDVKNNVDNGESNVTSSGEIYGDLNVEDNTNNFYLNKEKVEWIKIQKDETIEISLNGENKRIRCLCYDLIEQWFGDCSYEGYRTVEFAFVDEMDNVIKTFFMPNSDEIGYEMYEISKIIDIVSGKEYLLLKVDDQLDCIFVILDDDMFFCAQYDMYQCNNFGNIGINMSGEFYTVPTVECYNTGIEYYDMYGATREYGIRVPCEYKNCEKSEQMTPLRRVTIENGVIKDEPIGVYDTTNGAGLIS